MAYHGRTTHDPTGYAMLTLHHYPFSPFSEKIRALLGYAGLPWQSVIVPEMPPRPHLDALVGGYRKIPVAQSGADMFCDSRLITAEIASLADKPGLSPAAATAEEAALAARCEGELFFACMMCASSPALRRKVMAAMSWKDLARFAWDRFNMGRTASVPIVRAKEARPMLLAHLADLERRLGDAYLGGVTPRHVDFAAYHGLWFIRDLAERNTVREFPAVNAWMDRIAAYGQGQVTLIDTSTAMRQALETPPRPLPEDGLADARLGRHVSIAPTDYGHTPTTGRLVAATADRWILARERAGGGAVHVHFPTAGYAVTPL